MHNVVISEGILTSGRKKELTFACAFFNNDLKADLGELLHVGG